MTDHHGRNIGRNSPEKCSRHAAAIETLLATASALAVSRDIQAIPEQTMIQVSRLSKPKAWSLHRRGEKSGALAFRALLSAPAENLKGMRLPAGHGVTGCCCSDTGQSR
jgi:hypothetical protein